MFIFNEEHIEKILKSITKAWSWFKKRKKIMRLGVLFFLSLSCYTLFHRDYVYCNCSALLTKLLPDTKFCFPLSKDDRITVTDISKQLSDDLKNRFLSPNSDNSWFESQIIVAINSQKDSPVSPIDTIKNRIFKNFSKNSNCWEEFSADSTENFVVTGWCIIALSKAHQAIAPEIIQFILTNQQKDKSWPVKNSWKGYSSTGATAWIVLALNEALSNSLVSKGQILQVKNAINSGCQFLVNDCISNEDGLCAFYPNINKKEKSISLTGLTIHSLEKCGFKDPKLTTAEKLWMENLCLIPPPATQSKMANEYLNCQSQDNFNNFDLPWIIIGTIDSYKKGSYLEKVNAIKFVKNVIKQSSAYRGEIGEDKWISAELKISLDMLIGKVSI
jgi:hypothetical protein